MWQSYAALAEQRLQEMYDQADMHRMASSTPKPARPRRVRRLLGQVLVTAGERLIRPVETPVAH